MFGKRKQISSLGVSVILLESLGREYERDVFLNKTQLDFDKWLTQKTAEIRKINRATALQVI